jgi:hypothetical protein
MIIVFQDMAIYWFLLFSKDVEVVEKLQQYAEHVSLLNTKLV